LAGCARHPTFGRFPVPAMWLVEVLGQHLFLAAVGIRAEPAFVTGLADRGAGLFLGGVAVSLVPHAVALLPGRRRLPSPHPAVLLGACPGAGASSKSPCPTKKPNGGTAAWVSYPFCMSCIEMFVTFLVLALLYFYCEERRRRQEAERDLGAARGQLTPEEEERARGP
jgi:hypothetical protein